MPSGFFYKNCFIILGLLFFWLQANAGEKPAVGVCGIYNYQSKGIGFGVRGKIPIRDIVDVVPQVYYFPPSNIVNEVLGGINLHYNFLQFKKMTGYVSGGGFVDFWLNSSTSVYKKAKPVNIIPEVGGGIFWGSKCLRPFVEHRYNPVWREGTTHLGFYWYLGCREKSGYLCPAYL